MPWLCVNWAIDWTAVAAVTALVIWIVDGWRRSRERAATARLLAQIAITPLAECQVQVAKFSGALGDPDAKGVPLLGAAIESGDARLWILNSSIALRFDLPQQFIDKTDLFGEGVSNRLAYSLVGLSRIRSIAQLAIDAGESGNKQAVTNALEELGRQTQETELVIAQAFQALLKAGRASWRYRIFRWC